MKRKAAIVTSIIMVLALAAMSCARMPKPARSADLIRHHFKKYARKYPDTVYGKGKIRDVDITGQQEIHKHLVAVEAFITLGDGSVQRINATVERGPVGWRFVSWENATGM